MSRDVVSLSYRQGGLTPSLFLQLMAAPAGRLLWFVTLAYPYVSIRRVPERDLRRDACMRFI